MPAIQALINEFFIIASKNMGNEFSDSSIIAVSNFVFEEFKTLPVHKIGSAFIRGSLGKFGSGRLVPRTIYGWLSEAQGEFEREMEQKILNEHYKYKRKNADLEKSPLGSAIIKKIDWLRSGAITFDDWDAIPIQRLADIIASGRIPDLLQFGIKNRLS